MAVYGGGYVVTIDKVDHLFEFWLRGGHGQETCHCWVKRRNQKNFTKLVKKWKQNDGNHAALVDRVNQWIAYMKSQEKNDATS